MASLRRIASLDTSPFSSSNPACCTTPLTRHSSLPNLFLCQPELSMNALRKPTSSPHKCTLHCFPSCIDSPSLHTHSRCCKLSLCRALSSHRFDELSHFNDMPTADVCGLFVRPTDMRAGRPSPRKEVLSAASKQSIDLEKSIVYTELKESMWKFEPPPRFLKPNDLEANPCSAMNTHMHTPLLEACKPMKHPDLCMESSRHDVKGRPLSLRMLKRKLSQASPRMAYDRMPCAPSYRSKQLNQPTVFTDAYDPVSTAFASLFFIMKMLQQYAHRLRMQSQTSIFESEQSGHENLVGRACAEMLDSFLWLFQRVFSCTPRFMLLIMVLLADFTLHSMSMHVVFPVRALGEPPTPAKFPFSNEKSTVGEARVIDAHTFCHHRPEEKCKVRIVPSKSREEVLHGGNGDHAKTRYGGSNAQDPWGLQTRAITESRDIVNGDNTHGGVTLTSLSSSLLHHVHEKPREYLSGHKEIDLDVSTKHMLVAPVHAPALEADNYPCFDRTDLAYQHQIGVDPNNPLLLVNYAQFLHLVRHDYRRAEELYKKAVSVEGEVDGEVMGKFASFLWVAKGDMAEADRAFKAATVADPTNAFHAGNYAYFLWNCSGGSQDEEGAPCGISNKNNS